MITHRPVIGSLRNSGKAILLNDDRGHPREVSNPETLNCTSSGVNVKIFPARPLKPAWTLADVTFRQKSLRRANHHVLLFSGNTKLRQRRQVLLDGARSNFQKCQCLAIVTDEIDFALIAARSVIPGYEYVPLPPQIPVCIGFSSHAGAPAS
jgi:hypothetical protein